MHKILGQVDILGSPIVLGSSIVTGVTAFFAEPAKAKNPEQFAKGLGKGRPPPPHTHVLHPGVLAVRSPIAQQTCAACETGGQSRPTHLASIPEPTKRVALQNVLNADDLGAVCPSLLQAR
jgi:Vacuolar-sorting-associated 13 protein C-terminal